MSIETTVILNNYSAAGSFITEKFKGSGYHRRSDALHTFIVAFNNWSGELKIQATLNLYPNDSTDWVDLAVFGDGSSDYDQNQTFNSTGNYLWIRAIGSNTSGEISQIRFNY